MIEVADEIVIARPPGDVFAEAADPERQLRWDAGGLQSAEKLTPGPLGLGSRYRGSARGVGSFEYEFVEWEPGRRFAHLATIAIGEIRHVFELEPVPEGTLLRQAMTVTPTRLGRLLSPLVGAMLRKRARQIGERLKDYAERGPAETGR